MTDEELDDLVEEWHTTTPEDGYNAPPLHEFLGMTWDEYAEWTRTAVIPARLAVLEPASGEPQEGEQ